MTKVHKKEWNVHFPSHPFSYHFSGLQASRFRLLAPSLSLSSRHLVAPSGGWGWTIAEVRSTK